MARRWYVAVPVLLVMVALAARLTAATSAQWASKASVVLLAPVTGGGKATSNPYLSFGDTTNLLDTAALLTQMIQDPSTAAGLRARGDVASWTVGPDGDAPNSPALTVGTRGDSRSNTVRTRDDLVAILRADLANSQRKAGAPANTYITASVVVEPSPSRDMTHRIEAGVGGAVAALVVTGAAAVVADRRLRGTSRLSERHA